MVELNEAIRTPTLENLCELNTSLRSTLSRIEHAVGVLNEGIAWTDQDSTILWCNPAFVRLSTRPLFSLIGKPIGQALALSLNGRPLADNEHPVRRALASPAQSAMPIIESLETIHGDQARYLEVYASCLRMASGTSALMVVRDLTERRLAEQWLELDTARSELIRAAAAAANETEDPEEALECALALVARFLGWPLGRAFLTDPDGAPLPKPELWFKAAEAEPGAPEDVSSRAGTDLEALARVVAEGGIPVSSETLSSAPSVAAAGLAGVVAFPVKALGATRAVLEFFGPSAAEADPNLAAVLEQIAVHLGRVFERQQSRQSLLRAKQDLEARVDERTQELTHLNSTLMGEIESREKIQRALGDAMRRHRSLLESVRDVVFALTPRGRIDSLNAAFQMLTGRDIQELMSRRALSIVHPEDRRLATSAFRKALAGLAVPPFEVQLLRADGSTVLVECNLTLQAFPGQPSYVTGIARDVTESRRAQAALIVRDRAMAATSEGIVLLDARRSGQPITFVNPGFERMTGYTADEALGQRLGLLGSGEAAATAMATLEQAIEECRPATVEMQASRKGGGRFWTRLVLTPVLDDRNRPTNFVAILSDISPQKEAERMKNEFVSTVSHELRTPLTSLRGFAELMLERDYPPAKQRKFIQIIHKESTRLSNLINDFLDVQRMESGRQEYTYSKVPIATVLADTAGLFRPTSQKHEFVVDCEEGLPEVRADVDRLRQVTTNLVSNAVKFSPSGGEVRLTARRDPRNPAMVVIGVNDQGIGIPADAISKLFEKFYRVDNTATRKIGGTGLGLSIVRQIVDAHGGRIWVESKFGSGSKFLFTLPVFAQPPVAVVASH